MVERAGVEARLGYKAHPHMLRHACGYSLANKGHDTRALRLPRSPQYPTYGALHRIVANAVSEFLARVTVLPVRARTR